MNNVTTAAAYFATLTVAFVAAAVIPAAYLAAVTSPSTFKALIAGFNNACEVELLAGGSFATFRGTRATAEGIARYGYEVRHIAGDKYMVKRSRIGVRVEG